MSRHRITADPVPILARILVERGLHADTAALDVAAKLAASLPDSFAVTLVITAKATPDR